MKDICLSKCSTECLANRTHANSSCSNQTPFSICFRYIYKDNVQVIYQVTKYFCRFVEIERTDLETISNSLLAFFRNRGFNLPKLRRQNYDGCSTITGEVSESKAVQP